MSHSPADRSRGRLDVWTGLAARVALRLILPAGLSADTVLLWLLHTPALAISLQALRRAADSALASADASLFRMAAGARDVALRLA